MSFEIRDLMVKLVPSNEDVVYAPDCKNCDTTGTGMCPEPSECEDCKDTNGDSCEDTCAITFQKEYPEKEAGPRPGMALVLLQQQLRQTLSQGT